MTGPLRRPEGRAEGRGALREATGPPGGCLSRTRRPIPARCYEAAKIRVRRARLGRPWLHRGPHERHRSGRALLGRFVLPASRVRVAPDMAGFVQPSALIVLYVPDITRRGFYSPHRIF